MHALKNMEITFVAAAIIAIGASFATAGANTVEVSASSTVLARLPLEAGEDSTENAAATADAVPADNDAVVADAAKLAQQAAEHIARQG